MIAYLFKVPRTAAEHDAEAQVATICIRYQQPALPVGAHFCIFVILYCCACTRHHPRLSKATACSSSHC